LVTAIDAGMSFSFQVTGRQQRRRDANAVARNDTSRYYRLRSLSGLMKS
jgi:hypothetical protein